MAELFIELFSEEIPVKLQIDAREKIKHIIERKLKEKEINFSESKSFSTPQRLVFLLNGIPEKINEKKKILKGPKVDAPQIALDGFVRSNNLDTKYVYKKKIEKGEFYFAETQPKVIKIFEELQSIIPDSFQEYTWKKSMKWSVYDLTWGRPLKSIISLFNNKVVNFKFHHFSSGNLVSLDEMDHKKTKKVNNFKSYLSLLKSQGIILDHEKRKNLILEKINKICVSKNLKEHLNEKLLEEVVNLVEKPNVIMCKFEEIYLKIPQEILIITMQYHQKFFPLFDNKGKLTNLFLLVANLPDIKSYIKIGNQRVVEARLSDAKFFWDKNKNQSLVKQVSKLKSLLFFNRLGTFFDKTQRYKRLASLVSEQLSLNKEKVEIASSVCKADLVSDLVGEFPELQGVMGKYFATEQGFDGDVAQAIEEHYLPIGSNSEVPKKTIGLAVSIIDKIDNLVGFFGIEEKPTSSKDPYALRRAAIGLLRIIVEKRLRVQIKELINFSISTYKEQNINFSNNSTTQDVLFFLRERFKNLLKDKKIRSDIIEAIDAPNLGDDFLSLYLKCSTVNKNISKEICKNIISSYKRAANIIEQELKKIKDPIVGQPEEFLFKTDEEKNLYGKINEIRQYFSNTKKHEIYEETLKILSGAKITTDNFFNNVIVNDTNSDIKKNRLELLQMFCKTCNNFIDFSKMEGV